MTAASLCLAPGTDGSHCCSCSLLGKQASSGPTAQFYLVLVFVAISLCLKPLSCGLRLQGLSGVTLAWYPSSGQGPGGRETAKDTAILCTLTCPCSIEGHSYFFKKI